MLMDRKTGHNSTLAISGVSSQLDSFVIVESFVLRIKICVKNPKAFTKPQTVIYNSICVTIIKPLHRNKYVETTIEFYIKNIIYITISVI